jgi:hypothetical protein
LRQLPFLLPFLAFALVVWLQPPDHMAPYPDRASWVRRMAYDDWDLSSMALRGVNASLGRKAGLADEPSLSSAEFAAALRDPDRRLNDRYHLEYPLTATWLFRLPFLIHPVRPPAALCDGSYGNVLFHRPADEAERALWHDLRRAAQTYAAVMAVCLVLLMAVVRAGYEPGGGLSGSAWLLVLPGALYFTLNRFDMLPALLTALGLACLGRRWLLTSAAFLAAATLVKVYPLLLAPLVLRYLWPDRRAAVAWAATYGVTAAALLLPSLLASDWQAVLGPYVVQLSREPMGPTIYAEALPKSLAANDALGHGFRFGSLALVMLALCLTRPPDLASVLRRGTVAITAFMTVSVFYSPQWVLWLSPLLVPLAGRSRPLLVLVVALDLVTYLSFAVFDSYGYLDETMTEGWRRAFVLLMPVMEAILINGRYAVLGAIVVLLVWNEWPSYRLARTLQ